MLDSLAGYDSPDAVLRVQRAYILVAAIAYFVLVWDWASNLANEWRLVLKPGTIERKRLSLSHLFLLSRYVTLLWCTFVIATTALLSTHPNVCNWFPYYTYGYSVVSLFAHLVMVTRVHSIYNRERKVLWTMLGLAVVDFAIQMAADHLVTSVMLNVRVPRIAICFILPTSMAFALVFISPTIFHHLILGMTLWRSIKHIRITKAAGIGSIMEIVQRDHIFYVLAICLINFTNLILVLQGSDWPYGLVNQFPAAAFTQIFLSRIVFNLRHTQLKMSSGTLSTSGGGVDLASTPTSRTFPINIKGTEGDEADDSAYWETSDEKSMRKPSDMSDLTLTSSMHILRSPGKSHKKTRSAFRGKSGDAFSLSTYKLPSPRIRRDGGDISPTTQEVYHLQEFPSPTTSTKSARNGGGASSSHTVGLVGLGVSGDEETSRHDGIEVSPVETGMAPRPSERRDRMDSEATLLTTNASSIQGLQTPNLRETATADQASRPLHLKRRTIDEEQAQSDWDPPSVWQSPSSPRTSPLPYDERRLSESMHHSISRRGSISGSRKPSYAAHRTGSIGYASLFSLDELIGNDEEKDEKKGQAV